MRSLAREFKRTEKSAQSRQLVQGLRRKEAMARGQDILKTRNNLEITRLSSQMNRTWSNL